MAAKCQLCESVSGSSSLRDRASGNRDTRTGHWGYGPRSRIRLSHSVLFNVGDLCFWATSLLFNDTDGSRRVSTTTVRFPVILDARHEQDQSNVL